MTERVSDGLLAELQHKMDDGTFRGMWPVWATLLLWTAHMAVTPEEVAAFNEVLLATIESADAHALAEMEIAECVEQLRAYRDKLATPDTPK